MPDMFGKCHKNQRRSRTLLVDFIFYSEWPTCGVDNKCFTPSLITSYGHIKKSTQCNHTERQDKLIYEGPQRTPNHSNTIRNYRALSLYHIKHLKMYFFKWHFHTTSWVVACFDDDFRAYLFVFKRFWFEICWIKKRSINQDDTYYIYSEVDKTWYRTYTFQTQAFKHNLKHCDRHNLFHRYQISHHYMISSIQISYHYAT